MHLYSQTVKLTLTMNVLFRARTLQRQDASASYQDPAYQSYPDPWAEPLQPNGYIPGPPPPPAPGPVTNTFTRNPGVRRRLPDDTYVKKKPWHNLLTGWSTDDLTQNRENQNHQYNSGTSNGYPANGNVTLTASHFWYKRISHFYLFLIQIIPLFIVNVCKPNLTK